MRRRRFLGGTATLAGALVARPGAAMSALPADLPSDPTDMSAGLLSDAIRARHLSCAEAMSAYLKRIHRYNPVYNALVSLLPDDRCLELAREADSALDRGEYRGWMHGMPHAVKDLADAAGLPTSDGSPIFAGRMATQDALMIARIRRQGAIFIGKTNAPEFGVGSQTYNPVFGATGSACNPALTAGGSSGGAASGLGTRMLPVADGGDLMGSLRNPAAFNNVIGFRPTQGRVPGGRDGDLFYQQLVTGGPMGRNTADTIRLLCSISGHDPGSPLSLRDALPPPDGFRPLDLKGLRIGWLGDYGGYLATEPGVLALCESSLAAVARTGATVEPCRPEFDMQRLWETWLTLRHWGSQGMRALYDNPVTRSQLKPEVVWEIEGSMGVTAEAIYEAGIARADWYRTLVSLFEAYDLLALPTAQVFPYSNSIHWPAEIAGRKMDTYHRWMEVVIGGSLGGLPVISVPVGFDAQSRPMGMQLMGPFGEDRRVLEFGLAYEQVTDHLAHRPALVAAD